MPHYSMTTRYTMAETFVVYINCEILWLKVHDLFNLVVHVTRTWPLKQSNEPPMSVVELEAPTMYQHWIFRVAILRSLLINYLIWCSSRCGPPATSMKFGLFACKNAGSQNSSKETAMHYIKHHNNYYVP